MNKQGHQTKRKQMFNLSWPSVSISEIEAREEMESGVKEITAVSYGGHLTMIRV